MYQPIDWNSMDRQFGAAIGNIFVGYYEDKLFEMTPKLTHYVQYVDDVFI